MLNQKKPRLDLGSRQLILFSSLSMLFAVICTGQTIFADDLVPMKQTSASLRVARSKLLRIERDIVYHTVDGQSILADMYRPENDERLPVVVMIHGGAWFAGDKWNVMDHATQLAESGCVVMAINYRLSPSVKWPKHLEDCQAALRWLVEHAATWNADLDRLGVWGYSAGGQLALMLALDQAAVLPKIRACAAGCPPCNLEFIPLKSQMLAAFLGGSREQFPDRFHDASPINKLSADDPPLFIFHGSEDLIVPFENSREFYEKAKAIGVSVEYHEVQKMGHLMTFLDSHSRTSAIRFLKEYLTAEVSLP